VFEGHRLLATVDFAWPEAKLIVEAEGFEFHSGREAWEKDIGRYNSLLLRGWTVLRLTSEHLRGGGEDFALSLSTALANAASQELAPSSGSEKNRRTRVQT
jgi:very-short-patch-repair endonuclease